MQYINYPKLFSSLYSILKKINIYLYKIAENLLNLKLLATLTPSPLPPPCLGWMKNDRTLFWGPHSYIVHVWAIFNPAGDNSVYTLFCGKNNHIFGNYGQPTGIVHVSHTVLKVISSQCPFQKVPLSISDKVCDRSQRKRVPNLSQQIKQGHCFLVIYSILTNLSDCKVGMQEWFLINQGKGWLCNICM